MTPFFSTAERIAALEADARTWDRTPFVPHSAARGLDGGVDCVHLCQELLVGAGHMERVPLPQYPMDWGDNQAESIVLQAFESWPAFAGRFQRITTDLQPAAGDVLCFQLGVSVHHIGLMLTRGHFIHALRPRVSIAPLSGILYRKRIADRLVRIYRPLDFL